MLKKRILITLLSVLGICMCKINAQELNFEHYSVDKGLPGSQVFDITQDKNGNLWFATDQGISKYDGYSFKNYTIKDGLTDNMVFKFHPQTNGDIWCTTFNKSIFCIRENTFAPYPYNNELISLPDRFVTSCIYFSKDGSLFMSFASGYGYIHINKTGKIIHNTVIPDTGTYETVLLKENEGADFFFIQEKNKKLKVSGKWDHVLCSDQNNGIGDYIKACFFNKLNIAIYTNPREILIKPVSGNPLTIHCKYEPISLGKLNEQQFWVGFRYGGVGIFNIDGKQQSLFLQGKSVTSLFIDHEGAYWFSTLNDGVFKIKNTHVTCYPYDVLKNNWINSLTKDRKANLWIGYYNGDVSMLSGKVQKTEYISTLKKPALVDFDSLSGLVYYTSDEALFSNEQKGTYYQPLPSLCFYVHTNDSILVGGYRNLTIIYNRKLSAILTGFRINDINYYNQCFYVAGNKGLYKLQNNKATLLKLKELPSSIGITDIDQWNTSLVLATQGAGIFIMNGNSNLGITEKDGLSNNIINEIHIENENTVWACTNSGLNRIIFDKKGKFTIDVINNGDGLISNEVTDIEVIRDTAWVGTRQGLCSFPLKILEKKRKEVNYFLSINDFKVNDKSTLTENGIKLNYDQNRIEFNFGAVSFSSDKSITYRYQLIGHESNWNYTSSRSTMYTSLPPGSYTFCVQAKVNNSSWEYDQQKFSFVIAPPFWKTWWFIVSATVFAITLIYLFFKFRILSYNRDITRELLRQLLKRLTKKTNYVVFKEKGKDIRISTNTIYFVRSDDNYIEIHTDTKKYVIRYKIGDFLSLVPDPLEYLRISRSCIVRLDKVQEKSKKDVTVKGEKIPVGETYLEQIQKIKFQV